MMGALDAGGIPPNSHASPLSYETSADDLYRLARVIEPGRSIKLLDWVLHAPLPDADWRFVWLDRDRRQQAKSQVKFISTIMDLDLGPVAPAMFMRSYRTDRPRALARLNDVGPVHVVAFEDLLADPTQAMRDVAAFLAPDWTLDPFVAAATIHRRSPECLPDLAVELASLPPAAD